MEYIYGVKMEITKNLTNAAKITALLLVVAIIFSVLKFDIISMNILNYPSVIVIFTFSFLALTVIGSE